MVIVSPNTCSNAELLYLILLIKKLKIEIVHCK